MDCKKIRLLVWQEGKEQEKLQLLQKVLKKFLNLMFLKFLLMINRRERKKLSKNKHPLLMIEGYRELNYRIINEFFKKVKNKKFNNLRLKV